MEWAEGQSGPVDHVLQAEMPLRESACDLKECPCRFPRSFGVILEYTLNHMRGSLSFNVYSVIFRN